MRLVKKLSGFLLVLVFLFSVMHVPAAADEYAYAKVTGTVYYDRARSMLDLVNDFRTGTDAWFWNSDNSTKTQYAAGELKPLVLDPKLEQIAMERARELAVCYDHTRPDGTKFYTLTVDGTQSMGENIAYGQTSASAVFTAWREDNEKYSGQGHRRNMLNSSYTAVGFGCFYHQGTYYWIQEFGQASGEALPQKTNTESAEYVRYSTAFLGEDYWTDEGNYRKDGYIYNEGDWGYTERCGIATIREYTGSQVNVTIPSRLGGYPVKKIGEKAFYADRVFQTVVFPEGLETIGAEAFYNAYNLSGKITIPASVKSIGRYAFSYTKKVTEYAVNTGNTNYCSYQGVLFSKDMSTLYHYPLASTAESFVVPEETKLLYCTSFASASNLKDVYVLSRDVSAMGYTFNRDTFNVWCWPESNLYSQISNASIYGNVSLHSLAGLYPVITEHPKDASAELGKSVTFSVKADGTDLTYQWYYSKNNGSSWTKWSGKTSSSVSVKASTTNNKCLYKCAVTNVAGSITSDPAKLTVFTGPVITSQPVDATVDLGSSTTFSVQANGTGLKYQWYYSKNNGSSWTKWSGKTAASVTVTGSTTNHRCLYRCVVSSDIGSTTSDSAMLTVYSKPVITRNPVDAAVKLGGYATFSVEASGLELTYQWYYSKDGGNSYVKWDGKTKASITVKGSTTNNGCLYSCVVSNNNGSALSPDARLTVISSKPVITSQPSAATVNSGSTVQFSVSAGGTAISYQWQVSKDNGTAWTNVSASKYPSARTNRLSFATADSHNGYLYRCAVTNLMGSVYSDAAKLTVIYAKPYITKHPADQTVAAGGTVKMQVTAAGTGLTYQWQYSKDHGASWVNCKSSGYNKPVFSFTSSASLSGRLYHCIVSNSSGSVTSAEALFIAK